MQQGNKVYLHFLFAFFACFGAFFCAFFIDFLCIFWTSMVITQVHIVQHMQIRVRWCQFSGAVHFYYTEGNGTNMKSNNKQKTLSSIPFQPCCSPTNTATRSPPARSCWPTECATWWGRSSHRCPSPRVCRGRRYR